ncbi:MAG: fumarate hydratase [Candidatus Hydrothermarchaeales archaeon]
MKEYIVELIRKAQTDLPEDVERALRDAYEREEGDIAKLQLENILKNVRLAREHALPMCQDTGIPIFYMKLGKNEDHEKIKEAIIEGVREATVAIPLRPNIVDPLNRENPGDNTGTDMPYINWSFSEDESTEIIYMPKGAGSENTSALRMLKPSDGVQGIKDFVLETVKRAGGNPCPPTIIGIGIGGSFDVSAKLAKEALLRPLSSYNSIEEIAKLERGLLRLINQTGIGPMGLGGKTTSLKVNIKVASCHTASLPVAVNIQCWAHRIARMRIRGDEIEIS